VLAAFFLFKVVFLTSGVNDLHACANKNLAHYSLATVLKRSRHSTVDTAQNNQDPIIKTDASGTGTGNLEDEILLAEYEEDDLTSFKRHSESDHYLAASTHELNFRYSCPYIKECPGPLGHSRYSSCPTSHVLFGVFRR
jgi:hypothetical protein